MHKSLKVIASAAIAFSMSATAVMAETPAASTSTAKTAADFSDLANIDTGLKAKIDALLAKGVLEGVSADTFGINQTMTRAQFAKVATLILGLQVDNSVTTSSFSDVKTDDPANGWAVAYIEAAKKAGLIDGITDTTFAPGDNVTIGQFDTVLLKGLKKNVDVTGNPWYADAVKQATELGIQAAGKDGASVATRTDLVIGAYETSQLINNPSKPEEPTTTPAPDQAAIKDATAMGPQTVQVNLDRAVDTSKASLSLQKNSETVPVTVSWSDDKQTATLSLKDDAQLSNGTYTVSLGGLGSASVTYSFTYEASVSTGDSDTTIDGLGAIANVIDSDLTEAATGENGYVTRDVAENPILSKFAKEVKLKVTNSSGEVVAVPGIIQAITSSDSVVARVGLSSDHKGYVIGNEAGTATLNIVYKNAKGETKQTTVPVTVKTDSVTAVKAEADTKAQKYATVTDGVYTSDFNAYTAMNLKVYDNYGIKYEKEEARGYNFALGIVFIPEHIVGDPAEGPTGTVTIASDGAVHVEGNVTQFDLTAKLTNGNSITTEMYIRR
ncbi:S-layer homology domain-containing protein [Paenibacillus allorhizosphaerae]|uniref:SLH domain-containing protein n=1 Tax=Paenibacillus allorhizosphaerae TaxID=2849866 RepID=A0ABM8VJQ1_9BACL|nr:S-layer homology domain-containing protein [Paenibacillus allorhizosphaerae]CAG7645227.1 hypothetical protein PAECIP111802_03461 [Paenibacillus allorhizosphaerae]